MIVSDNKKADTEEQAIWRWDYVAQSSSQKKKVQLLHFIPVHYRFTQMIMY